ncbi:SsrA-binding protein SmpB [Gynuella sp.]|uniref:SsrA-binding protein SmpB n=1 Tax=Gynuella sp. TaxID=2969146 RepID=UPI003D142809
MAKTKSHNTGRLIAQNKKARHDYHIEDKIEAGLALSGWELKSLRAGKAQLRDSYVIFNHDEAWLVGAHISPLSTASTHVVANPVRDRKILMHRKQIDKYKAASEQSGYTIVALDLHWSKQYVKCEIALVKGKKLHDKRETIKEREWNRQKERVLKHHV